MLAISPARIQIIQAGQNEPSILSIGSQAVKKNAKIIGKAVFRNLVMKIVICALVEKLNLNNFRKAIGFISGGVF